MPLEPTPGDIEVVERLIIALEEKIKASIPDCVPQPQKALKPPTSQLQAFCRLRVYVDYLLAILACGGDQACCNGFYALYCIIVSAC